VREAINTYGLSAGAGLMERGLNKMTRLSRTLVLTISNTFRHKGRVILTQITLVLSGLIFMMVMSVRDAADYTFGNLLFEILRFDINLTLEEPERIKQVEALALAHPDVKAVEMWAVSGLSGTTVRPANQPAADDDEGTVLFGVPLPTELYGPQVRQGRWLLPGENRAVVLNQELAEDLGVGVGEWVTFDHGLQGETTWQVVGLIFDPIIVNSAHVSREALLPELDSVGKASTIWIQTVNSDPAFQIESSDRLRTYFEAHQIDVSPLSLFNDDTATEIKQQINNNFGVIIYLLATMAVVIGVVGSIALSGILSLNVMERRREIGVMRAIGASSGTITRIFVGEGVILGLLSWLIAFPLSLPAGRLMTQTLSVALGGEMVYRYTPTGPLLWLVIITVLSIAASWLPARGASRVSVRQSLAYQ
jgi:putative ABC transport system permease protein